MPERLFGLPAHPLVVHLPVVMIPLAAILAILLAVRPKLSRHYGIALVVLTGLALGGSVLGTESGEGLEHILNEHSAAIERHAEWGERTRLASFIFFLVAVAYVFVTAKARRWADAGTSGPGTRSARQFGPIVPLLAGLLVVTAVASTAAVMYTGHTGAKSAWEDAGKAVGEG